ncbi:MAG: D-tyrosyl-tRNA(Tyr) deacylase [Candidatus Marinimicrobia bacterium]|nr:D-tyrosyl-tRNA(Tyr) deacylase [Candidatus Neomarinimicrobiota bacterium]
MIAVVQRVKSASVTVGDEVISKIDQGYLILLAVAKDDTDEDAQFLAEKISTFRIFSDGDKNMNLSIQDVNGSILVVSQFTLCGDWRKGRRPSFSSSAPPEMAEQLYLKFSHLLQNKNIPVQTGQFAAMMDVELINDGPVTFVMDSKDKK